ncbi:MAG: transposase [Kiritimatiellae bacterium]|nr:transposase [Kiritimatiellia bacterium]
MHKTRRRFRGYDYARGGAMFVTTCLEPRRPLFGRVDHERVALSESGEIAKRALMEAVGHFSGFITLRAWTIMPDHVHLRFTWPAGHADAVKKIGAFVGRFKQFSQYHVAGRGPSIWEEGYHDLICTSERMNRTVDAYIGNNALKWWLMHGDKSLMHVVEPFPLPEAGDDELWRAVGNFDLLEKSRIVSLRISQKVPESELPGVVAACRRGALEKGYVYASTFFSPGERMVFKALAAEESVPMIRLVPTFMELAYRPHGVEPLLFAKKRLLVLSRMADPAEPPRRGELVGLNYIAAAIARASEGGRALYVTAPQGGGNQVGAPTCLQPLNGAARKGGNRVGRVVYGEHPAAPSRGDNLLAAPSRGCKKGGVCNR